MPGQIGAPLQTAGWPNLVQIADLALGHFNQICDPDLVRGPTKQEVSFFLSEGPFNW